MCYGVIFRETIRDFNTMSVTATIHWYNNKQKQEITVPDGGSIVINGNYDTNFAGAEFTGSGTVTIVGNGHTLHSTQEINIDNGVTVILDNYSVTMDNPIVGGIVGLKNGSEVTVNGTSNNNSVYPTQFFFYNSPNEPGSVLNIIRGAGPIYNSNVEIYNLTPGDNIVIGSIGSNSVSWKKESDGSYTIYKPSAEANNWPEYDKLVGGIHLAPGITPDMFEYDNAKGEIVCYLAGSKILTNNGRVAVEHLKVGDLVACFHPDGSQYFQKISWVGKARARVNKKTPYADFAGYPVTIKKDAFGYGAPYEDLRVTNEHCLYVGGAFVPVRMLVNGRNIVYNDLNQFWYYHFELENHAIIDASGIKSESFLNTGNMKVFPQARPTSEVKDWSMAAAPLNTDPTFVKNIYEMVTHWAETMGYGENHKVDLNRMKQTIYLEKDGKKVFPFKMVEGRYMFMLPHNFDNCELVTSTVRHCDVIGPWHDDRREIEVSINEISRFDNHEIKAAIEFDIISNNVRRKINTDNAPSVVSIQFN